MNTLTTNIIRNIINLGGSSTCDAGTQYCQEGYSLYFPCLKDVTKGQNVCFDFYVADNATKDVVDLRDVDAITLSLTGAFGCSYGDFSYPDNISSLQTEKYPVVYENDFGKRRLCHIDVTAVDTSDESIIINDKENDFYSGTSVYISAYDTPTHIFMGWVVGNQDDETCEDETWDDIIVSKDNVYKFIVDMDINIFALYRPRKVFSMVVDSSNRNSHYNVTYNQIKYFLSNQGDEIFNDGEDRIDVLEGYHVVVECIPNIVVLDDEGSSDDDYMYKFYQWKDGLKDRCRIFCIGENTKKFENDDEIRLLSKCSGPVDLYDLENVNLGYIDIFDTEAIHIDTEFSETEEYEYYGDKITKEINNVNLLFCGDEGLLHFNDGRLLLTSGIEDGVKINIYAKSDSNCELLINVNGMSTIQTLGDDFKLYEFYFSKCDNSLIEIISNGECFVDKIEICKEEIIDKGKASLCLDSETTSNLPSGPLSISGAIMVNGQSYGLASTSIGSVNKLKKITIV